MAEQTTLASGLGPIIAFALEASGSLEYTVKSFRPSNRTVSRLEEELEALNGLLQSLQQVAIDNEAELGLLELPLLRCGEACKGFKMVVDKLRSDSDLSRARFLDWTKLIYMGDSIGDFTLVLAGYKATIAVALGVITIRTSAVTSKVLTEYKEMLVETKVALHEQLQRIDNKIELSFQEEKLLDRDKGKLQKIQDEKDSVLRCGQICENISDQFHWYCLEICAGQDLIASQLDRHCESDAACRTLSFVDSGVGMSADGSSSIYSISHNFDARYDLVAIIIRDEELETIFGQMFDGVDTSATEQHVKSAIIQFARDLRSEAQNKRERSVASIIRIYSAYVANCIRQRYSSETDQRAEMMHEMTSQLPQTRERLEKFLSQHDEPEDFPDRGDDGILNTLPAAIEEDDWDENELRHLPHLEQLESFIMSSQALVNLRRNVQNPMDPWLTTNGPFIAKPQLPKEQQTHEPRQPIGIKLIHSMSTNAPQDQCSSESGSRERDDGSHEAEREVLNKKALLWERASEALKQAKRAMRPRVPEGYTRIEWTCDCGQLLFDDYKGEAPELVKIAAELQQLPLTTSDSTLHDENHSREDAGGIGDANNGGQKDETLITGNTQNDGHSCVSQGHKEDGTNRCENNENERSTDENGVVSTDSKFFELCVNNGKFNIILGEINITGVNNDGDLFKKIYETYKTLRGHRISRIFIEPVDIHFVRFSVEKRYQADIYEAPLSIPPPEEVEKKRYHYAECPLKPENPMGHRTFIHYMYKCRGRNFSDGPTRSNSEFGDTSHSPVDRIFSRDIFLKRLPKKIGSTIVSQDVEVSWGWGVHVIEGPNKTALSWATFLCLLLSFVVSVVYCHVAKTQEQGFSIGQWMVAVLAAAITALYFHSAET